MEIFSLPLRWDMGNMSYVMDKLMLCYLNFLHDVLQMWIL